MGKENVGKPYWFCAASAEYRPCSAPLQNQWSNLENNAGAFGPFQSIRALQKLVLPEPEESRMTIMLPTAILRLTSGRMVWVPKVL